MAVTNGTSGTYEAGAVGQRFGAGDRFSGTVCRPLSLPGSLLRAKRGSMKGPTFARKLALPP